MTTRKALLIGAEKYGKGFMDVPAAPADVELIDKALSSRGFECTCVSAEVAGNPSNLDRTIADFCKRCERDDVHVVYFSGHGIEFEGRDYIVPAGVSRDEAQRNSQLVRTDYSMLIGVNTGHILFIIDACRDSDESLRSRRWGSGDRDLQDARFMRFLGCVPGGVCWDRKFEDGRISVFTQALADVLLKGADTSLLKVRQATKARCAELAEYPDRTQAPRFDLGLQPDDAVARIEFFPIPTNRAWLELGKDDHLWVVVLQSEGAKLTLAKTVATSLKRNQDEIERQAGKPLDEKLRVVSIREALESPRRWLQTVEALCKAPVLIADATDFEAGIMLCLGIRAVVRRGVTLTATIRAIDEKELSELPFNIQQIKLIGYAPDQDTKHPQHPVNLIGSALRTGLRQLRENPAYHDLPGFDSVRCLEPPLHPRSEQNTVLVLCPFQPEYRAQWRYLSNQLEPQSERLIPGSAAPLVVRMRDMESPQLVGSALYEHLRWSKACVADWSHWRANVFFELGVRIACCEFPPVHVIAQEEEKKARDPGPLGQHAQLLELFRPTAYQPEDEGGERIEEALERNQRVLTRDYAPAAGAVAPYSTYESIVDWYDWKQEEGILSPDEEMRRHVKGQMGKDPQKSGLSVPLYSENSDYLNALRKSAEERWIAAWSYVRNRYSDEKIAESPTLQLRLAQLGEEVQQALSKRKHPAVHAEIKDFRNRFPSAGSEDPGKGEP